MRRQINKFISSKFTSIIEDQVRKEINSQLREYVKYECVKIVTDLFEQEHTTEINREGYYTHKVLTVVGKLREYIIDSYDARFKEEHRELVLNYIKGEEFIDNTIERINCKQLKP